MDFWNSVLCAKLIYLVEVKFVRQILYPLANSGNLGSYSLAKSLLQFEKTVTIKPFNEK